MSRWNYAFSDFPFPKEGPEYAHHTTISKYIDSYVDHFDLAENIQYETKVVEIHRLGTFCVHATVTLLYLSSYLLTDVCVYCLPIFHENLHIFTYVVWLEIFVIGKIKTKLLQILCPIF